MKRKTIEYADLYKLINQIEIEGHETLNEPNLNRLEMGQALGAQNGMCYAISCLHLWLQGNDEMISYKEYGENQYEKNYNPPSVIK